MGNPDTATEEIQESRRKMSLLRETILTTVGILLYLILGNARSIRPNPFIPGANIAINMIVPVAIGLIAGPRAGLLTGLFGTSLNYFTPVGSIFEALAIVPHAIMGFSAGFLQKLPRIAASAVALSVGHLLNILVFASFSLLAWSSLSTLRFWSGIGYEIVLDIIGVIVMLFVYYTVYER